MKNYEGIIRLNVEANFKRDAIRIVQEVTEEVRKRVNRANVAEVTRKDVGDYVVKDVNSVNVGDVTNHQILDKDDTISLEG